jgi:hypothetical protein
MAGTEIVKNDEEEPLLPRQLKALEQLVGLGHTPRLPDQPYHSDPKIRALQLVYEGRLGGGRQAGKRQKRAGAEVARKINERLVPKIVDAIEDALDDDSIRIRLAAADMALRIERDEASLQLKEDEIDRQLETHTKEELIETLFTLARNPQTEAAIADVEAIGEIEAEEITDAIVVTDDTDGIVASVPESGQEHAVNGGSGVTRNPPKIRANQRKNRPNGRGPIKKNREKVHSSVTETRKGRAAD